MRKFFYLMVGLVLGCDSENANDCFQTSGTVIRETILVPEFDRILVNRDITLVITEGPVRELIIETGENLKNDVKVKVIDNQLILTDSNTCNYVRDFGITTIYVQTPRLTEIINSSQYDVSSNGVLSYPSLNLISENFNDTMAFTVGDYRLDINNQNLNIVSNGLSFFYITGATNTLSVRFFSGAGRFEGAGLAANHIEFYHRGSNDMVVNPIQSLTGELRGTGNVVAVNQPPVVDVDELYTGHLIFN